MKKKIFILSVFLGSFMSVGSAHAEFSDQANFNLDPTTVLKNSGKFAWPSNYNNTNGYPVNIYFDFNQNPFSASGSLPYNAQNMNFGTPLNPVFTNTKTGAVKWFNPPTPQPYPDTRIGINQHNESGSAIFSFDPQTVEGQGKVVDIWAEITVTTTGNSNNYVTFAGLSNVKSSEIFSNNGTLLDKDSSGLFSYDMTGDYVTYDALFVLKNPGSTEDLDLDFNTGNGKAFVNDMHIAMTPEPVSMALFAVGTAVLFFFKRRRGLQLAI